MKQPLTPEEYERFRKDLPTTLGYYQATVTMMSIFLGFSFAALLQVLTRDEAPDGVVVNSLVLSLVLFMMALGFLAVSTHQVFRCWKVFFPESWFRRIGSLAMSSGMLLMFATVSWLLYQKQMVIRAWLLSLYGVGLLMIVVCMQFHLHGPHCIDVSEIEPCHNVEPPTPGAKPIATQ